MIRGRGRGRADAASSGSAAGAGFTATPLVDIVFLLIIFFMLVAQFARQRAVELEPPVVAQGPAAPIDPEARLVVHVLPRELAVAAGHDYRFEGVGYGPSEPELADLAAAVSAALAERPDSAVHLRADRAERWTRVRPALGAIAGLGVGKVRLVARADAAGGPGDG